MSASVPASVGTRLPIKRLRSTATLPVRATEGAAGLDLFADLSEVGDTLLIAPGARVLVPTGISMALPEGHEGQVRPRSGLANKYGVTVLNAPGTIDADYRGEVKVILVNHGDAAFVVRHGDRIAQLVVAKFESVLAVEVGSLDTTERGEGGFGSSGR